MSSLICAPSIPHFPALLKSKLAQVDPARSGPDQEPTELMPRHSRQHSGVFGNAAIAAAHAAAGESAGIGAGAIAHVANFGGPLGAAASLPLRLLERANSSEGHSSGGVSSAASSSQGVQRLQRTCWQDAHSAGAGSRGSRTSTGAGMRFSPSAGPTGNEEHVTGSSPRYTAGRSQGHSHSPGAPASPHQRTPNHFTPIAAAPPRTPAYKRDHDPPRSPVSGPRRTLHGPFQGLPEPSPEPAVRSGPGGHEQHAAGAHAQKYTHAQEPSRVNSHAPGMVAASGRPSQHGGPSRGRVTGVSCDTLTPPYPLTTLSISLPEDGESAPSLPATSAPVGVACDEQGHAYVADAGHCRILKLDLNSLSAGGGPACAAIILAGGRGSVTGGGRGGRTRFTCPMHLALAPACGMLLVSDQHAVKQVDLLTGRVHALAGCGVPGYADGPAVQARFHNVRGIAVDAKGTVYIADSSNHCIRVLQLPQPAPPALGVATGSSYQPGTADTATGTAAGPAARLPAGAMAAACVVTTLSGCAGAAGFRDGSLAQARFRNPAGLAIDGDGCVLVADAENHCVRRIDSMRGTVTTIAGCRTPGAADGPALRACLHHPQGLAVDGDGHVVIADLDNHRLRMLSAGRLLTLAGGGQQPGAAHPPAAGPAAGQGPTGLFDPQCVAITSYGAIVVTEGSSNKVRYVDVRLSAPHVLWAWCTQPAPSLSSDMGSLLELPELVDMADVTFMVCGVPLRAHRPVLSARCDALGAMLRSDCREGRTATVEVEDCSVEGFAAFLRYLYTDALDISSDVLLDVMLQARKYMINQLFQHCCAAVRQRLSARTALPLLAWAEEHCVQELMPVLRRYAHQHLAHIVERHPHTLRALEAKPGLLVALLQHSVQRIGGGGGGGAVLSLGASQGQGV